MSARVAIPVWWFMASLNLVAFVWPGKHAMFGAVGHWSRLAFAVLGYTLVARLAYNAGLNARPRVREAEDGSALVDYVVTHHFPHHRPDGSPL